MKIKIKTGDKIWIPGTVAQVHIVNNKAYVETKEQKGVYIPIDIIKKQKK